MDKSEGSNSVESSELRQRIHDLEEQLSEYILIKEMPLQSCELFFSVLAAMPATICLQASDYTIRFANQLFKKCFGDSEGKHCYELLHGRTSPCEECLPFKVLKTGEPEAREWANPDGRHFLVHYFPFKDVLGERMVLEMGFDISERKRAEDSLKESELMLRRIADNMTDMIGLTNPGGVFTYITPS